MPNPNDFAELRDRLESFADPEETSSFFFERIASHPNLYLQGDGMSRHEGLENLVRVILAEVLVQPDLTCQVRSTRIPRHGFYHGTVTTGGALGCVIYFEDGGLGLISLISDLPGWRAEVIQFQGSIIQVVEA